jgi:hypothetical protein
VIRDPPLDRLIVERATREITPASSAAGHTIMRLAVFLRPEPTPI